jgi:hypothetical protein
MNAELLFNRNWHCQNHLHKDGEHASMCQVLRLAIRGQERKALIRQRNNRLPLLEYNTEVNKPSRWCICPRALERFIEVVKKYGPKI